MVNHCFIHFPSFPSSFVTTPSCGSSGVLDVLINDSSFIYGELGRKDVQRSFGRSNCITVKSAHRNRERYAPSKLIDASPVRQPSPSLFPGDLRGVRFLWKNSTHPRKKRGWSGGLGGGGLSITSEANFQVIRAP